jgi:hypothetical protein
MEAGVLGSEIPANTQAKLLGTAFSLTKLLDAVERDILILLEKPLAFSELLILTKDLNIQDEAVFAAVTFLLQQGLVLMN